MLIETLLHWNFYSGDSLWASLPFGGYHKKLMYERHARGDAKAGGEERKGSSLRIIINFHFNLANPGTLQSVKTVTANAPQIRKVTTAVKFRQPRAHRIYFLSNRFHNSFPLHQSQMFFTHWCVFFIHWTWNINVSAQISLHFKSCPHSGD